ncbi:MAG TPA: hypothetical protein ENJ39_08440 [Flammeovirgaceae bacterium]|nr:hypothetical protein [Flammeovirgaceae bacterium]
MKRQEFLRTGLRLLVVSLPMGWALTGCYNNANEPAPQPPGNTGNCLDNGTTTSIGGNHGHSLTVPKADVQAGVTKTYSIQGSSGHNHQVTLTASHFASLQDNKSIQVTSTTDSGHSHSITVGCA